MGCGYVTVGSAVHRRVTPYAPGMDWLGEPLSGRRAARYEASRVATHRRAIKRERDALLAESVAVAKWLTETPAQRARKTAALNHLSERLAQKCECDICTGGQP